ncbi:HAD family hydrolase [Pseudomonas sp.]|uniref:HAD family hydrolase n=1 Tax=Pseudomonas sp. TaxID=306 RepID=UPI00262DF5D1|nr:HAD family hydrolase [Pseudomonas sp.]
MSEATSEPIALVLCDLDGTLLMPDHRISAGNLAAVKALQTAGVHFTLASGRPPRAMRPLADELGITLPIAGLNGAIVLDADGRELQSYPLPLQAVHITLDLLTQHDVEIWLFTGDLWLLCDPDKPMVAQEQAGLGYPPQVVTRFEPYLQRVHKIVAASRNAALLVDLEQQLQPLLCGLALASRSQACYLDVTALRANKGEALVTLAERLKVPLARTLAVGDGGNDPAMFKLAGVSVAMGHAEALVREQAAHVTGTNLEDGVAQAIERFILQPGKIQG